MCSKNESTAPARQCQWCGEEYRSRAHARLYCSPSCKQKMASFFTSLGKSIAADAMAWRRVRGNKAKGGAECFQDLCFMLDRANEKFRSDRPKGAPSINDYVVARRKANGITVARDK